MKPIASELTLGNFIFSVSYTHEKQQKCHVLCVKQYINRNRLLKLGSTIRMECQQILWSVRSGIQLIPQKSSESAQNQSSVVPSGQRNMLQCAPYGRWFNTD